jgi:hypothetical protein
MDRRVSIVNKTSKYRGQTGRLITVDRSRSEPCEVSFLSGETAWFKWGDFAIVQTTSRTISLKEAIKENYQKGQINETT